MLKLGLAPSGVGWRRSVLGVRGSAVLVCGSAIIEAGLGPSRLCHVTCSSYYVVWLVAAGLGPSVCVHVVSVAGFATIRDAGLGPSGVVFEVEPYSGGALHATLAPCKVGLSPFVTGPLT